PRGQLAVVGAPAVSPRAVVLARQLGPRGQDLVVEVAPGQLAYEGLAALALAGERGGRQRRDAPEVQARAEPRGPVPAQVVAPLAVAGEAGREPAAHPRRAFGLAAGGGLRRGQAPDEPPPGREAAGREATGEAEAAGRTEDRAPGVRGPAPQVGREDREGVAAARRPRAGPGDRDGAE